MLKYISSFLGELSHPLMQYSMNALVRITQGEPVTQNNGNRCNMFANVTIIPKYKKCRTQCKMLPLLQDLGEVMPDYTYVLFILAVIVSRKSIIF